MLEPFTENEDNSTDKKLATHVTHAQAHREQQVHSKCIGTLIEASHLDLFGPRFK